MSASAHISTLPHPGWRATGLQPRRCFRVFGMRRSGNHAIVDWLLRNSDGSGSVFFNNCIAGRNPAEGFRTIAVNGERTSNRAARADLATVCEPAGPDATFIASYEDLAPTANRNRPISGPLDAAFNANLILYRGFLNWCASLLKKLQNNPVWTPPRRAAIVLNAVDTYRQLLTLVRSADALEVTPVCYDDWATSEGYRLDRLAALKLPARDNSLGAVQAYGGGSSFDGQGGTGTDLGTHDRFMQMREDPELGHILALSSSDDGLLSELDALFPRDAEQLREYGRGPSR